MKKVNFYSDKIEGPIDEHIDKSFNDENNYWDVVMNIYSPIRGFSLQFRDSMWVGYIKGLQHG